MADYPNEPMGVHISSYKAPHVTLTEKDANFHLYATATFSVKTKQLFTFKFVSSIIGIWACMGGYTRKDFPSYQIGLPNNIFAINGFFIFCIYLNRRRTSNRN